MSLTGYCHVYGISKGDDKLTEQFYTNAILFEPACNATTVIPADTDSIVSKGESAPGIGR